jgi:hypothetical protein
MPSETPDMIPGVCIRGRTVSRLGPTERAFDSLVTELAGRRSRGAYGQKAGIMRTQSKTIGMYYRVKGLNQDEFLNGANE